jgi:SAM-dependent methyltransferase
MGPYGQGASPQLDRATEYFDRQASGYLAASDRLPWRWLRQSESSAVLAMSGPLAGAEVLELGAGAGYYTRAMLDRGAAHVWAVDRSPEMLQQLGSPRITPVLGDVTDVRVPRSFDAILAAGVFEFVASAQDVLLNAARHARVGAWLVVLYSRPSAWGAAFRAFHARHGLDIHLYRREQFDDAAARAGWRAESWQRCGLFCVAARYRLAAPAAA